MLVVHGLCRFKYVLKFYWKKKCHEKPNDTDNPSELSVVSYCNIRKKIIECFLDKLFFFSVLDGIMAQMTADVMKKIRSSIKDMQDYTVQYGDPSEEVSKKLSITWGTSEGFDGQR